MTVREAAGVLEVSESTVRALCAEGKLGHRRIGLGRGVIRIDARHIEEFNAANEVPPSTAATGDPATERKSRAPHIPDHVIPKDLR